VGFFRWFGGRGVAEVVSFEVAGPIGVGYVAGDDVAYVAGFDYCRESAFFLVWESSIEFLTIFLVAESEHEFVVCLRMLFKTEIIL